MGAGHPKSGHTYRLHRRWMNGVAIPAAMAVLALLVQTAGSQPAPSPKRSSKIFIEIPRTESVAVFDFETRRIIKRIDLGSEVESPGGEGPESAGASSGRYVYWPRHTGNDISVIDTSDYRVVGRIPLKEKGPGNVTVAPDGHALYIPHYQARALTIFDIKEKKQRVIPLDGFPGDIAVAPRGTLLVTSRDSNQLLAVEEATGRIRAVDVGRNPVGVAVTKDGSLAFVSHDTEATVSVINLTKLPLTVAKNIKVGATGGSAVVAGPDGKTVYVAHCCENSSLTVISVDKLSVMCELSLAPKGLDPARIVFSPGGGEAFVINSGSMNVSFFRPPCGEPVAENLFDQEGGTGGKGK
jgi:DNA-binding beta-propeller fold protein YncE